MTNIDPIEKTRCRHRAYKKAQAELERAGLYIGGRGLCLNDPYDEWFPVYRISDPAPQGWHIGYVDADCSEKSVEAIIKKYREEIKK